jgi:transcriptional regulator with XRE-family HTH domain
MVIQCCSVIVFGIFHPGINRSEYSPRDPYEWPTLLLSCRYQASVDPTLHAAIKHGSGGRRRGTLRVDVDSHKQSWLYNLGKKMSRGKLRNPENFSPEGQQLFERLVRLRKSRGVDQAGLARALGFSQALVWKWEADRGFPSGEGYAKLAQLAEDPDDRTYFMERALQEGAYLARVVKMMDTEEQRQFCTLMGVNLAAMDERSGRSQPPKSGKQTQSGGRRRG